MSTRPVLLQPRWLVAHVIILAIVATFPLLGLWQLDRWDVERDLKARIEARIDGPPAPLSEVLDADTPASSLPDLEFQPVVTTGTYVTDEEVAHRNRALEGQAGFDWLTPLRLDDGTAILVRRGFVPPTTVAGGDPTPAPPPIGQVTVEGWLEQSGRQPGFGPRDLGDDPLALVFHADIERIGQHTSDPLLPMVLHLRTQEPAQDGVLPVAQPVPDIDTSQNLSYAVQWFTFTLIAAIGYVIVLRRKAQEIVVAAPVEPAP